ncbi:MAG: CocE/NonD family hydrolase [Planctomycetota bacterium]
MMPHHVLLQAAKRLSARSSLHLPSLSRWQRGLPERRQQWLSMLGLDPLPERRDLRLQVTGILKRERHVVEKLHFQPVPGCRIAANLYRPRIVHGRIPAVVYVCGHTQRGKFHYQAHARWFAEHGYVCLILDAIQHGENRGVHHGTWTHGRWHWYSQGYSPVAVEVWAAMRAADYLQSRAEVDPARLGITGLSGGGTVSWFTAAADPRFRVVAPVCQTGNLFQHVRERTIDGHCDCSFWINTFGWDLPDVAALIAPRPLLVASATEDVLFRPYAFREVVRRTRKLYRAYGCDQRLALCEAATPHGYSPRLNLAVFNWFEQHLKGSALTVRDDIDANDASDADLRVYPPAGPPAADRLNRVDEFFIRLPTTTVAKSKAQWLTHQRHALSQLRELTFRQIPERMRQPAARLRQQGRTQTLRHRTLEFESEPGMHIRMHLAMPIAGPHPCPVIVAPLAADARMSFAGTGAGLDAVNPAVAGFATVEVRGTGWTSIGVGLEWTLRRALPTIGQTLYERRIFDLLAAISVLRKQPGIGSIATFGRGYDAAVAIYAALRDPQVTECVVQDPVTTHGQGGPELLNVLKIGDLPDNAALLLPRAMSFIGAVPKAYATTRLNYRRFAPRGRWRTFATLARWSPAQ